MEGLMRMLQQQAGGAGMGGEAEEGADVPKPDTSETLHISSLALLKMLKHGRAGVPLEVMGLMLGEFVDEYTITVVDVFAMPQSGTSVSVEAVDHVHQMKMVEMLKQTGRTESVVGWYHSHPGFGCWLSSTDCNTQQSFEQLHPRSVAVVVDPIQSVRGKVVIDAFRLISPQIAMTGQEPRQTTSNVGHLTKPSISALIHGLNRQYTNLNIAYRKNDLEAKMLLNLNIQSWRTGLVPKPYEEHTKANVAAMKRLVSLAKEYNSRVRDEEKMTSQEMMIANVGKIDPKRHLVETVEEALNENIDQLLVTQMQATTF